MRKPFPAPPERARSAPVDAELRSRLEPPGPIVRRVVARAVAADRRSAPAARLGGLAVAAILVIAAVVFAANRSGRRVLPSSDPPVGLPTITNVGSGSEVRLVLPRGVPPRPPRAPRSPQLLRIVDEATVVAVIQSSGRPSLIVYGGKS